MKSIHKLESLLIDVFKPTIKEYIQEKNPELLESWDSNCCVQTAIIVSFFLDSILDRQKYKVKAFEGFFYDILFGKPVEYNHAWVYVENTIDRKKSIFIDVARNHKKNLVMFSFKNEYSKMIPGYENQYLDRKVELDYRRMIKEKEYYTSKPGIIMYKEIIKRIQKQKLLKSKTN